MCIRDRLLLVCGRSSYRGKEDFDRNGRIYSREGHFVREILLGDGIQNVQTTSKGLIWTSFFDEGVFGNLGWHNPVGGSGLVAWDAQGESQFEFQPTGELDIICDCYAMNVDPDGCAWAYYYTQFCLVKIRDLKIESNWEIPVTGSSSFAVGGGLALFSGGYDDRDRYHLYRLGAKDEISEIAQFSLVDHEGEALNQVRSFGRGDTLFLFDDTRIFGLNVATAADKTVA